MILTKDKNEVVYIGRRDSKIMYVGRGQIGRAGNLMGHGHHIEEDFDEVEILGPYTHEESVLTEKRLIEEHTPVFNKNLNPKYSLREEINARGSFNRQKISARARARRLEREAAAERIYQRQGYREEVLNRIQAGDKLAQIARDFGVSRQRIHQIKTRYS